MLRILPILLLLVGCALQPITEPRRPNPDEEPTMVPTAIAVEKPTYTVENGSVTSQLVKSGRITPVTQNQLSFALNGRIDTMLAAKSTIVTAGDVVATLDTTALEQSLQNAEADLALAQEQITIAQESQASDLRRAEIGAELVQLQLDFAIEEAGETPTVEQLLAIEKLRLQLELAQITLNDLDSAIDPALSNQVIQAERQLENIKMQIAQSTLVTPISGTVLVANFKAGDSVAAEQTVFVVADLNSVEVQVSLLDRELQELSEGMAAFGTNPTQPETVYPMTVRQLPYPYGSGAENSEADKFVLLSFNNPAQLTAVNIGDRIEAGILLDSRDDVLWLPPAAIREFNGRLFVVAQDGETQKRLDIKVGLQNENQVEIISGVTLGQTVVGP